MSVAPMPKDDIATVAGMAIVATAIGTLAFLVGIGLLVVTAVRHAIAAIRSRRTVSK